MILKALSKERNRLLVSRGVPQQDLIPKSFVIDTEETFVRMEPQIPNVRQKIISAARQERGCNTLMEHPLRGNHAIGIGGHPTDLLSKYFAQQLFSRAIDEHFLQRRPGRSLPLWHRVYGGLTDTLRDKPIQDMPCMLVISNVIYSEEGSSSSNFKIEKVRDLLEKFSDIPRIVVSAGGCPASLFANKLHYPARYTFLLGSNRIQEV